MYHITLKNDNNIYLKNNIRNIFPNYVYQITKDREDKYEFTFIKKLEQKTEDNFIIENNEIKYFQILLNEKFLIPKICSMFENKKYCFWYNNVIIYKTNDHLYYHLLLKNNKICYYDYEKILILDCEKKYGFEYMIKYNDFTIDNIVEFDDGRILLINYENYEFDICRLYIYDIYSNKKMELNDENIINITFSKDIIKLITTNNLLIPKNIIKIIIMNNLLIFFCENSIAILYDIKQNKIIDTLILEKRIHNIIKINNKEILNIRANNLQDEIKFEYNVITIICNNIKNLIFYIQVL